MLETCYFCTRKHLGYAEALMEEAINGYPLHKWAAVGQMCAAEGEIMQQHPEMAMLIREHRVKYMESMYYDFPFMELIERVTLLAKEFGDNEDDKLYEPDVEVDDETETKL
jgi:hypothetical protein